MCNDIPLSADQSMCRTYTIKPAEKKFQVEMNVVAINAYLDTFGSETLRSFFHKYLDKSKIPSFEFIDEIWKSPQGSINKFHMRFWIAKSGMVEFTKQLVEFTKLKTIKTIDDTNINYKYTYIARSYIDGNGVYDLYVRNGITEEVKCEQVITYKSEGLAGCVKNEGIKTEVD